MLRLALVKLAQDLLGLGLRYVHFMCVCNIMCLGAREEWVIIKVSIDSYIYSGQKRSEAVRRNNIPCSL